MVNPYSIPSFIGAFLVIFLGIFVFVKNKHGSANIRFFLFTIAMFIWLFFAAMLYSIKDQNTAIVISKWEYIGVTAIPINLLLLSLAILKIKASKAFYILLSFWYLIAMYFIFRTNFILAGINKFYWGYYGKASTFHFLYLIIWLTLYIKAVFLLYINGIRNKDNLYSQQERNKIKYIFLILIFGMMGIFDFLPKYGLEFYPFGYLIIPIICTIVAYAIVKYQLMDINVIIRKSLVYSILITIFTVIYLTIIILTERIFQGILGYRSLLTSILFASIIALIFIPLKNKIQSLIDKIFLGKTPEQIAQENELLRQELMRSEKLKAVATFASGMAHEIKNPLTAIKTFTEYIPKRIKDKEFLGKFSKIVGSEVEKIDGLVHQLLDFSKPAPLQLKEIDIHKLLDETLELLSNQFIKYNIKINKDYGDSKMITEIDQNQMKQVFLNLFLNSIEAMPSGGTLTVSTSFEHPVSRIEQARNKQPVSQGHVQGYVSICIQDTGCGIPERDLSHIFEPFYSTKEKGSGLGLSIVYNIVKEHKGKIYVDTKINIGTKFIIELPTV